MLVTYKLYKTPVKVLVNFKEALINKIGSKSGIYALHKGNKIYYVGKATKLKSRIRHHLKDRHEGLWDAFSLYVIENRRIVPELEKILISLIRPEGNKLNYERELRIAKKELKKEIIVLQNEELEALFDNEKKERRKRLTTSKSFRNSRNKAVKLQKIYGGKKYNAKLLANGKVKYKNKIYNSHTAVAKIITKRKTINGRYFWGLTKKFVIIRK